MVNIKSVKCIEEDCILLPSCNYKGLKKRLYCVKHAKEGMINLSHKTCIEKDCIKNAYYNLPEKKERLYCRDHADLENMIDITCKNKLCIIEKCPIQACYNLPNEDKPLYCKKHSTSEMEDVRTKKCLECNKKPTFNYPDSIGALYCCEHSKENMINIYDSKCTHEGCNMSASCNYKGLKKRIYCTKHKLSDMINLSKLECEYEGCTTIPKYNFPSEKHGRFCTTHKLPNMIHLTDSFFCKDENCNKRPTFNYPNNGGAQYCMKHMKDGMVNVVDPQCKDCTKRASFNYKDCKVAIYCYNHSKEDMTNIYSLRCKKENCNIIIRHNNRFQGYCITCYKDEFPDEKIKLNYIVKEKAVGTYVKNNFSQLKWIFNKPIKNIQYNYRPDILLNLETHIIIIEVDEHQHSLYDEDQEDKRVFDIHDALNNKKMVFIRFNPDSYQDKDNNFIKSPWIYNKMNLQISSNKIIQEEWNKRLNILNNNIKNYIDNISDKNIEFIKLFYNEC